MLGFIEYYGPRSLENITNRGFKGNLRITHWLLGLPLLGLGHTLLLE